MVDRLSRGWIGDLQLQAVGGCFCVRKDPTGVLQEGRNAPVPRAEMSQHELPDLRLLRQSCSLSGSAVLSFYSLVPVS